MRICLDMGSFQDFDKFPVIAVIDAYEDKVRFNFSQITFTEIYAIIHRTGLGIRCKEKSKSLRRLVLPEELFYDVDLWLILVASIGGFFLATEAGFLLGRRSQSTTNDHSRSQIYTIQGAALGLLALLLGFTFAMAMSRYDTRKQIGPGGVQCDRHHLSPGSTAAGAATKEVSNLLRRYVEVRLDFYYAGNDQKTIARSEGQDGTVAKSAVGRRGCHGSKRSTGGHDRIISPVFE